MDRVRVELRRPREVVFYGRKIRLDVLCCVKWIYPTDEVYLASNGYENYESRVYVDAQGRRYARRETVDYADNVYYICGLRRFEPYRPQLHDVHFGVLAERS